METTVDLKISKREQSSRKAIGRRLISGFIGGLVGTLAMDIILMIVLPIIGRSSWTCFLHVGNTALAFFNLQVTGFWKIVGYGIATHYFIGPVIGILFGILAPSMKSFQNLSHKMRVAVTVIFIEILSQPLLASTPILLKWDSSKTLLWYVISFFMHFIMGLILGLFVSNGMRKGNTKSNSSTGE